MAFFHCQISYLPSRIHQNIQKKNRTDTVGVSSDWLMHIFDYLPLIFYLQYLLLSPPSLSSSPTERREYIAVILAAYSIMTLSSFLCLCITPVQLILCNPSCRTILSALTKFLGIFVSPHTISIQTFTSI